MKNWTPFLALLLSYEALQGIAGYVTNSGNVVSLAQIDQSVWGFNLTGFVQSTFSSQDLTYLASFLYSLHFPIVIGSAVFFWYTDKKTYPKYVYALLLTSYLSLVTFVLMPTAPPWYSGVASDSIGNASGPLSGLFNGVAQISRAIESDKFAAFPSLHGAYAILFSYFMIRSRLRLAFIALPITIGILFSTIYLGQHYLIDLVGGGIYAAISVVVVEKYLTRKKSNAVTIDVPLQVESQNEAYSSREGKSSSAS
ncbi:MAG: phosphatase PAP2 family protein [Thaumarchaeota archaeon]|nr:phosphatase PAP2 family protein [Nitrososphaerota archaeon]